jgi:hypothetical protein
MPLIDLRPSGVKEVISIEESLVPTNNLHPTKLMLPIGNLSPLSSVI